MLKVSDSGRWLVNRFQRRKKKITLNPEKINKIKMVRENKMVELQ